MSSNDIIERLVVDASSDPLDPVKNFNIAVEYEKLGQTASAVSFYLRAAEYGVATHKLIVYTSLLRVSLCIEDQKNRNLTVSNVLLQAMAYLPERPEAYFLMSRFHERSKNWQECYTFASLGLSTAKWKMQDLPVDVDYHGEYCLVFEQSVSAWWIGRKDESIELSRALLRDYDMLDNYSNAVKGNLARMGVRDAAL